VAEATGVTIGVLVERIKAVQDDVAELRQQRKEDHHRLRNVEAAVMQFTDAQKLARESEQRQYRRLGTKIALGGLAIAVGMLILSIVTILARIS